MFQVVPDTAQLRFDLEGNPTSLFADVPWSFSLYVRNTIGAWTQLAINQLAGFGVDWWEDGKDGGPSLQSLTNVGWTVERITATDLGVENGLTDTQVPASPIGTRAGEPYAPGAPALVQLDGAPAGVPKRGRVFWSGLVEADVIGGAVTIAARNSLALAFENAREALSSDVMGGNSAWAQVLVSRNLGTVPDPTPPRVAVRRATAVTNTLGQPALVRPILGSQRKRRPDA